MIDEIAQKIATLARRAGGRGLRIDVDMICDALGGDRDLAEAGLIKAGFEQAPDYWESGKGNSIVSDHGYPDVFFEGLTEILDRHNGG